MGHYAGEMDGSPGPNHQTKERMLERQIFHLAVSNANLRLALEEIDAVAVRKQSGAAKAMQAIARKALAPSNGDRASGT